MIGLYLKFGKFTIKSINSSLFNGRMEGFLPFALFGICGF